jgi:hypothetical protein
VWVTVNWGECPNCDEDTALYAVASRIEEAQR